MWFGDFFVFVWGLGFFCGGVGFGFFVCLFWVFCLVFFVCFLFGCLFGFFNLPIDVFLFQKLFQVSTWWEGVAVTAE